MEFSFSLSGILPDRITVLKDGRFPYRRDSMCYSSKVKSISNVINALGDASAKAQGLKAPITSVQKFQACQQTLYIMKDGGGGGDENKEVVVGILKVGKKHLFLSDYKGSIHEVEPLCVLDFYVHESRQRCGFGKCLFECMLKTEGKLPHELAIDRPSIKFLSFLRRHYSLCSHPKQANNFVVFDQFFTTHKDSKQNGSSRSPQNCTQQGAVLYTRPVQRQASLSQHMAPKDCPPISTPSMSSESGRRVMCDRNQTQSKYQRYGGRTLSSNPAPPVPVSKENVSSMTGGNWTVSSVLNRIGGVQATAPYLGRRQLSRQHTPNLGISATADQGNWLKFSKYKVQRNHYNARTNPSAPQKNLTHYSTNAFFTHSPLS